MGAWSHESFGNDTACDWSYGLLETTDLSVIEATLGAVIKKSRNIWRLTLLQKLLPQSKSSRN